MGGANGPSLRKRAGDTSIRVSPARLRVTDPIGCPAGVRRRSCSLSAQRYLYVRPVQQLLCQWRRSASPAASPKRCVSDHTTKWAMPGVMAVAQPGQIYVFSAFRAVMVRTIQSPSGALSLRAMPDRARSKSSSGDSPVRFQLALAESVRRGRLERGMTPFCPSRQWRAAREAAEEVKWSGCDSS